MAAFLQMIAGACTDDLTGPDSRTTPPTPSEYALQLRGDLFLANIADLLGRPELTTQINDAILAINSRVPNSAAALLASSQMSLAWAPTEDAEAPLTEADVLSAVIEVTLDRLGQIADSAGGSPASPSSP
jgi:hypothetical protein